jgi:biopolymer transport protein ExbD
MFMVLATAGPDLPSAGIVDLPEASNSAAMQGARREDSLLVAVQRDGKVYLDTTQMKSPEDLIARIREGLSLGAERKVYIKADRRAHYRAVAQVVDAVHKAGVERVGLLTEQRRM